MEQRDPRSTTEDAILIADNNRKRKLNEERRDWYAKNKSDIIKRKKERKAADRNPLDLRMSYSASDRILCMSAYSTYDFLYTKSDFAIDCGTMDIVCQHCSALRFPSESAGICCNNGKVRLPKLPNPPEPLLSLFNGVHAMSSEFLENIISYNMVFQMVSFGVSSVVSNVSPVQCFKIKGQIIHRIGDMAPRSANNPQFLQLYFLHPETQVNNRLSLSNRLNEYLVKDIQESLLSLNAYVGVFSSFYHDLRNGPEGKIIIHADKVPSGFHKKTHNLPEKQEVAGILIHDEYAANRDVIIRKIGDNLQRINECNKAYDPLCYPILFPLGSSGWCIQMNQGLPNAQGNNTKTTCLMFYKFYTKQRSGESNYLLKAGYLFQQYLVDMWAKIESQRLSYFILNQQKLRVTEYWNLTDAVVNNDQDFNKIGQRVILPTSFQEGPRKKHEQAQNALAYVTKSGKPCIFWTVTCNASWPEIVTNLLPGQTVSDRPDLVARVFHLKVLKIVDLIVNKRVFGPPLAYVVSIEWQKRGLPHCHILIWLQNKLRPDQFDSLISAEIPDPQKYPNLYNLVMKLMIHNFCGEKNPKASCMNDKSVCSKKFPKQFQNETTCHSDGYPLYRRLSPEDGGFTGKTTLKGKVEKIDNRWVIPYCPLILELLECHSNVEYCGSIKSIKYVCKYIFKGDDRATISATDNKQNEILQYQNGRYISSSEAVWRINSFPTHYSEPPVHPLPVHLEDFNRVRFEPGQEINEKLSRTQLSEFFTLCQNNNFARSLLYHEVPEYFTWNMTNRKWMPRVNGFVVEGQTIRRCNAVGRVHTVHPNDHERFFLRLLLHQVRGPVSYEYLKMYEGKIYSTFREACLARGYLDDDIYLFDTLKEASETKRPTQLRELYTIILLHCEPSNPRELFEKFKHHLAEDFLHRRQGDENGAFRQCILEIEKLMKSNGKTLLNYQFDEKEIDSGDEDVFSERFDAVSYQNMLNEQLYLLNGDQKLVFDKIMSSKEQELIFLDAPGGTGKTFVLNLILASASLQGWKPIAVASSGIAATLLLSGKTAHSTFKLPLDMSKPEVAICNIQKQSKLSQRLKASALVVWDECTMTHKKCLEAVDLSLRDICDTSKPFGGKTVLLSGDFRQTIPVVPKGTRGQEVAACLKFSRIWPLFKALKLTTNMRSRRYNDTAFTTSLLQIGENTYEPKQERNKIDLGENLVVKVQSVEELIDKVFPSFDNNFHDDSWLMSRAILTTRNDESRKINDILLDKIPAQSHLYRSTDSMENMDDITIYPTEILNSCTPPGFPRHELKLKLGCIVMCLRNLNPPKICNGTRLVIKELRPNVVIASILSGRYAKENVFIPRISLITDELPFRFRRIQFPLSVSFGMTINKSQGQTFESVGLSLTTECFAHGQLYVALSRTGTSKKNFFFSPNNLTKNIVYDEVI